jgi:hypothetical protein
MSLSWLLVLQSCIRTRKQENHAIMPNEQQSETRIRIIAFFIYFVFHINYSHKVLYILYKLYAHIYSNVYHIVLYRAFIIFTVFYII